MSLTLDVGLSKEVVLPGRGSRRASVSVRVELDAVTLNDPARLKQHIRCGFDRLREAIEEELARPEPGRPAERPEPNGNGQERQGGRPVRPATASQLRLLRVLAGRKGAELADLVRDRCGRDDVAELSLAEASRLIEELNGGTVADGGR